MPNFTSPVGDPGKTGCTGFPPKVSFDLTISTLSGVTRGSGRPDILAVIQFTSMGPPLISCELGETLSILTGVTLTAGSGVTLEISWVIQLTSLAGPP